MKRRPSGISLRASLCASVVGLALPGAAWAQTTTIDTPTTASITATAGETLIVTETGSISRSGRAVLITGTPEAGTVTIINRGMIRNTQQSTNTGVIGPIGSFGLNLTNEAGATIEGPTGVFFATGELTNRGTIVARSTGTFAKAAISAADNAIVRLDAGSVTSATGGGSNYAVSFTGSNNSVYVDAGASVTGSIRTSGDGAGNRAFFTDTTGVTSAGPQTIGSFSSFNQYNFESGRWFVDIAYGAALGSTVASGAELTWGNGGNSGSIGGRIVNDGTLIINRSSQVSGFATGSISGTGVVIINATNAPPANAGDPAGPLGGLTLNATGTDYSGNTIVRSGTLRGGSTNALSANSEVIVETAGILDVVSGFDQEIAGLSGVGATQINGALLTLGTAGSSTTYSGAFSGDGSLVKAGAGTFTYDGTGALGGMTVRGGGFLLNGNLTSGLTVESGATFGGAGTLAGAATVNGTLVGTAASTLTLNSLVLGADSTVAARLGAPSTTALFDITGDLTLDGTLQVAPTLGFGTGVYRIFNYGGTLTDNGLDVTIAGGGAGAVQTNTANQINLLVTSSGAPLSDIQFWNGAQATGNGTIAGGSGTWTADTATTNWTDAAGNTSERWGGDFAVFAGQAGTVTVSTTSGAISPTGMQFATTGYRIQGDPLTLAAATNVRVGDGSAAGAATTATIASQLTGAGSLTKQDLGTLVLTGANDYSGGTNVLAGTLQIGDGGATGVLPGNVNIGAAVGGSTPTLAFNRSDDVSYGGSITGQGRLEQQGSGIMTLTGDSSAFAGATVVSAGGLRLAGTLGSDVTVDSGARFGGAGTLAGAATVNGTLVGNAGTTFTMNSLVLGAGSTVLANLGAPSTAALFNITGNLMLDGTLEVSRGVDFGAGVYRIFTYGGTLTNDGLDVAAIGDNFTGTVQTNIANQVNLVVASQISDPQFWNGTRTTANGTIAGGSGTWTADTATTNWTGTAGTSSERWGGGFAVFAGQAGTVTVSTASGAISPTGMQFATTGYRIQGDPLTLAAATNVRVGDGSTAGAATTATIASQLTGAGSLTKQDLGTLVLTGANDYSGGTNVLAGTLQIGDGGATGVLPGNVNIGAAVGGSTPTLAFNRSDDVSYGGSITGQGRLEQ
ncbi:beta strand repeat-containing protein, partial [Sphingosinicella sp. LY1275]|uniref:beta strand repeat-containing protein n=1 Tax=Sphingosinicella sp. LY1275 TaxID=3095379 RepID=UPI002ADEC413